MGELREIRVIFEDNHLLVVEKPVNVPVCEDSSNDEDMLTMLKRYLKEKYKKPGNVYLGLVHRLDRPVGGVMVFAKTSKAASRLSNQVREHSLEKVYVAVVRGKVNDSGEFVDYLRKDEKRNKSFVTEKEKGKLAKLRYKCLGYKDGFSLVEIYLETGRSHQIRVQFSSRGFPLVGDVKYSTYKEVGFNIALFAKKLSFYHPVTKEIISFSLELPKRYPFDLF